MNSLNLRETVEEFLAAQAGEVSDSTLLWYSNRLRDFAAFAGDDLPLKDAVSVIRAYKAGLKKRMTPSSVHGYQRAVRRLFSWMVEEGTIQCNIARNVPLIRLPEQPPHAILEDDLHRLLNQLPRESARDRAIVLFLADTGCRVGGLCSLTFASLDLPNRCALVVEKGRKSRRVYFNDVTAAALSLYLTARPRSDYDAVFIAERGGQPLGTDGVRLMLRRMAKRAGVKGRHNPHSFRHAFARSFLWNGGNLATLGRLMGHAPGSSVTARSYAIFDDRELQEFHGRFGTLARMESEG